MNSLQNITFLHPQFLLLLLLPLLWGIWYYVKKPSATTYFPLPSLAGIENITSLRGKFKPILPLLKTLSYCLIVFALARPQLTLKEEEVESEGIDIMMVMDVSPSMDERDINPSRIDASKSLAVEFVEKRKYDRIGLVVFALEAYALCPLTTDHLILSNFIKQITLMGMGIRNGTSIGVGLATAVNKLENSKAKSKIIILLTDGADEGNIIINPEHAAEAAKEKGIKIYTIGLGRKSKLANFNYRGLNEKILLSVAEISGGQFFRAQSRENLAQIYDYIDKLEKSKIEVSTFKRYSEEFRIFLSLAIILLLFEFLLRHIILKTIP